MRFGVLQFILQILHRVTELSNPLHELLLHALVLAGHVLADLKSGFLLRVELLRELLEFRGRSSLLTFSVGHGLGAVGELHPEGDARRLVHVALVLRR